MREDSNDSTQKEGGVGSVQKKTWITPTLRVLDRAGSRTDGKTLVRANEDNFWTGHTGYHEGPS
jgi:hypothetical protein